MAKVLLKKPGFWDTFVAIAFVYVKIKLKPIIEPKLPGGEQW
jgi:hypothetical protein